MAANGSQTRVLLVEDNPGDAHLIKAFMREAPHPGFELVWTKSLDAALQAMELTPMDAVLLDLGLPDTQGLDTLSRVNAHTKAIPIVVLTGSDDERLAAAAVTQGAQDYLPKGDLNPPMLFRTLRYAMERHRREMALRDRESLFRILANSAPVLLWLSDEEDQVAFFNHTWLEFTGRSLMEECGWGWLNGVHPLDRRSFQSALASSRPQRKEFEVELRLKRFDGDYRWVMLSCAPRLTEGGGFLGYIGSGIDLTEHRREEEALRQTQKLEGLGLLAGGIAHDFNNLLAAILGNAEIAQKLAEDFPSIHHCLRNIQAATLRASELTRQMLSYAGKGVIHMERLTLNPVVREIGELLRVTMSKKIDLVFDLAEDLPVIEGDMPQLQQVVMNLVTNAADAIGEVQGKIAVQTQLIQVEEAEQLLATQQVLLPGPYVLLEVEDSGSGMSPEVLAKMFDPFYTTKATGRGLGLSAVLGILKGHGAGIRIRSAPGRGTRFQVLFPAKEGPPAGEGLPPEDAWMGSGLALVVDDELAVLTITASTMEYLGYEVVTARDGQEALDQVARHGERLSFILMDMNMPGLNGLEAARIILKSNPEIPIVLCSGYPAEIYGMDVVPLAGFLQKPYRRADLVRVLQGITQARG